MPQARILVVEDDPKTAASVRLYLEHAGYQVQTVGDGRAALAAARDTPQPDLVVLDWMLPQLDGLAVCKALRGESRIPVIMLTARTTEVERLQGLDHGADDYVSKPFSPRELVARVRAVLRRTFDRDREEPPIRVRDLTIDPSAHAVAIAGRAVCLTPREFGLLMALARSPGRVFTRQELVERAFGGDSEVLFRTVDAHVMNLRRKLEKGAGGVEWIETVFGVGYRFVKRAGA